MNPLDCYEGQISRDDMTNCSFRLTGQLALDILQAWKITPKSAGQILMFKF